MGLINGLRQRITAQVQAEFDKIDAAGFEKYEAELAQKRGRQPDQTLSREDVVEVVKRAGVGRLYVGRVADGIMERIDSNGGGITAQEWARRSQPKK